MNNPNDCGSDASRLIELSQLIPILCWCALVLVGGCDQPFDPRGSLDQKLVVFSVLSTDREKQFVRVQANYMPPLLDPVSQTTDPSVTDAQVIIVAPTRTYLLRDTVLGREDTDRYDSPIRVYYVSRFTPERGKPYMVDINSPTYGSVSGSVTLPDAPKFSLEGETRTVLEEPNRYGPGARMVFVVQLSKHTKGYIGRLILYYDVMKKGKWEEEAVEIPIASYDSTAYSFDQPVYPGMTVASTASGASATYRNGYYKGALNQINERYLNTQVIYKWATYVVLQADSSLFDYYANTHASQDPHSMRLDEPLVSRVRGGIGLVGAYSLDSAVYLLPYNFWGNR